MKNSEVLPKDVQDATRWEHLSSTTEIGVVANVGKHLKTIIYITSLAGIALFFTACEVGYVATEPAYTENVRPAQPSNVHVWIDGDWVYNRQSRGYVRNNGYWEKPAQGRNYVPGHWQTTPKGHYWTKGHYQRNRR